MDGEKVFGSEAQTRAVRSVVKEEERSRNVVNSWLERGNEKLNDKVANIEQKARAEVCRVRESI